jgi:phosphate transport system substrate-binding protein
LARTKKTVLISILVIVPVAIVTLVLVTPLFQPRFNLPPEQDESENTQVATTDNRSNGTAITALMPTTIDILSSTSAFPFVQRWIAQYENQQLASSSNVNVDYLTDGEIIAAESDSGRSDLAIVGVHNENNKTLYVPVSAQAVAIVYNIPSLPDIPTGLRLSSTMLSLILNGSINEWDDAAIKELNPNLNLPHERIVVVHSGGDNTSSSSYSSQLLLNQYLGSQNLRWPKNDSIITSGPAELAEMVRKIPYSIGYVDFSYAVQTRMTYAAIENADGDYVVPSTDSIHRAVDLGLQFHNSSTDLTAPQQQQQQLLIPPSINASRIVSDAYPIVGLYYASLFATNDDKEEDEIRRNAAIVDVVEWIISESGGQLTLLEVQYPSIYSDNEQLVAYAEITMDTIQKSN